ncbi:MAG TPA: type III pantothenate kinase [Actinomycetota bacterium]|nr:type III pantothenate kinase [Actinomycetota bacterium]
MLLAVNVGNTETTLGVFRDQDLAWRWRMATVPERTADELAVLFGGFLEHQGLSFDRHVTGVVLSSVVPTATEALREMVRRYFGFPPVVVEAGVKTGIPVLVDNPREVGADRIVNAVAAHARYGAPAIAVDVGTATTVDAVTERGEYVGGAISAGIRISARALYEQTARLVLVELTAPRSVIGRNTVEALQSGLVYGHAAMIDGLVERMAKELGNPTVVMTGGLAGIVFPECRTIDHHEPWLTLEGLRVIFDKNTER